MCNHAEFYKCLSGVCVCVWGGGSVGVGGVGMVIAQGK